MLLLSQDYGKHLLGVEDLLQKHALVEADIAIQADRVKAVVNNANKHSVTDSGEQTGQDLNRSLLDDPSSTRLCGLVNAETRVLMNTLCPFCRLQAL